MGLGTRKRRNIILAPKKRGECNELNGFLVGWIKKERFLTVVKNGIGQSPVVFHNDTESLNVLLLQEQLKRKTRAKSGSLEFLFPL